MSDQWPVTCVHSRQTVGGWAAVCPISGPSRVSIPVRRWGGGAAVCPISGPSRVTIPVRRWGGGSRVSDQWPVTCVHSRQTVGGWAAVCPISGPSRVSIPVRRWGGGQPCVRSVARHVCPFPSDGGGGGSRVSDQWPVTCVHSRQTVGGWAAVCPISGPSRVSIPVRRWGGGQPCVRSVARHVCPFPSDGGGGGSRVSDQWPVTCDHSRQTVGGGAAVCPISGPSRVSIPVRRWGGGQPCVRSVARHVCPFPSDGGGGGSRVSDQWPVTCDHSRQTVGGGAAVCPISGPSRVSISVRRWGGQPCVRSVARHVCPFPSDGGGGAAVCPISGPSRVSIPVRRWGGAAVCPISGPSRVSIPVRRWGGGSRVSDQWPVTCDHSRQTVGGQPCVRSVARHV